MKLWDALNEDGKVSAVGIPVMLMLIYIMGF